MSTRTETGIAALVLGLLVLIVAASFNVWSIEQLIVPDKQLQGAASIIAIALCQTSCLVLAMWLLIRRPELKASLPILVIGALLTTASAIGVYGSLLAWSPKPWKAPGIPMVERLRLLEEQSWMYPNEVGIGKYRWLLRLPIFSNSVSLRFSHGVALLEEGRTLAAIDVFRQLMRESADKEGEKEQHSVIRDWLAIAHLRRGEQANCIARHSADVCIFPIRSSGVHLDPTGSTSAITELKAALSEKPQDLNSRWLLNIAYMTLGNYPQEVPKQWLIPPSAFQSEFDIGRFKDVAPQLGVAARTMAGGSIVEDFNGDGSLDIFTSSTGHHENLNYFQNQGDGTFSDRTHAAGLSGQTGGLNLAQADYDNDGAIDVLVARGAWRGFMPGNGDAPNSLLRNNGDGTFTDVTEESGLLSFHPTQVATWADFNNDGWVDLFLGNESQPGDPHPVQLYRNNRGIFEEVSKAVGLNISGMVKGAAWEDYDNDGYADLYISRQGQPNMLFHNGSGKGRERLFRDVTLVAGVAKPQYSFPTWFFDYDNDGWQDLFVAGFGSAPQESDPPPLLAPSHRYLGDVAAEYLQLPASSSPTPRLYRNNQDGTFSDVTTAMSLDRARFVMGANFGDLDNDGYLDLYLGTGDPNYRALMPNRMFRSDKGRNFQDVTSSGGFGHLQKGHGIAFGDLDNDGDQDIYAQMGGWYRGDAYQNVLFRNPGHGNNWITLRLRGVRSNAAAIGARITLTVRNAQGKRNIYIAVGTGGSFGASSLQQEIGLGTATAIERLEIYWPVTGLTQTFEDLQMNRIISIREDSDTLAITSKGLE